MRSVLPLASLAHASHPNASHFAALALQISSFLLEMKKTLHAFANWRLTADQFGENDADSASTFALSIDFIIQYSFGADGIAAPVGTED